MSILIFSLILTSCANHNPREWTDTEVKKEIVYQVLNVVDFALTEDLLDEPMMKEQNFFIGSDPTDSELIAYAVGFGTIHWALTDYFINYDTEEGVQFWQNFSILLKAGAIGWNLQYKF